MKNDRKKLPIELAAVSLIFSLLFFSQDTVLLASKGLLIWYRNMIPALFPFMVLSGYLVNTGIAARLTLHFRFLSRFCNLKPAMIYTILMGFLCGFPMGAKVVRDQLEQGSITLEEGRYLLAFCNNIGPIYMVGYVHSLFQPASASLCLLIFYCVPLLYGLFFLKKPSYDSDIIEHRIPCKGNLEGFQIALQSAIEQITLLGGCMVFFNCLLIYPKLISEALAVYLPESSGSLLHSVTACLTEISSGLESAASTDAFPLSLVFSLLSFGGLCCIMQTCFILKNSALSIKEYLLHKILQAMIVFLLISLITV